MDLSQLIIKMHSNLNAFTEEVNVKYEKFVTIINELFDAKLRLSQLLNLRLKANKSVDDIKNVISIINLLKEKLTQNYTKNYDEVKIELNKVQNKILLILQTTSNDESLKLFNQRLIFFTNKFRNESEDIKSILEQSEKEYMEHNYSNSLDMLITVLQHIKHSTKISNVEFI
jgi:hypothetical protein